MTSLQIALCDDNSLSLQLAQLAIQEYERQHPDRLCRLHCFSSGTALLSFLDKHKDFCFDLFILDVVMPEPDGIQTGLELRARGDKGRIVYLSACPDFALSAYDVHAYSYLLKPIDRKKLFEILDNTHLSPRRPQARMFAIHVGSSVRMVSFDELISAELNSRTILYTLADGSVLQTPTIRSSFKTEVATLLTHEQLYSAAFPRSSICDMCAVLKKTACICSTDGRFPFPVRPAPASGANGRNTGAARLKRM